MPLFAEVTGAPGAPAIVFLHGVGTSGWMWWRQVPAFADHRCLSVDLPGHGRSRDIPWISLADTAGLVAALIGEQTATGRAHFVGLSLGGQLALALLDRHPDAVERAVVSGVTAEPWLHRWFATPQAWLTTTLLRSRRIVDDQARSLGLPPEVHGDFAENVRVMRPRTYRDVYREIADYALPPSLGAVAAPTLVLAGSTESDVIRRAVETIPATMPAATGRIVPSVGHGWNVEAPDLFNATVRSWIEGSPLPAGLGNAV